MKRRVVGIVGRVAQQGVNLVYGSWIAHGYGAEALGRYLFAVAIVSGVAAPFLGGIQNAYVSRADFDGRRAVSLNLLGTLALAVVFGAVTLFFQDPTWIAALFCIATHRCSELEFLTSDDKDTWKVACKRLLPTLLIYVGIPFAHWFRCAPEFALLIGALPAYIACGLAAILGSDPRKLGRVESLCIKKCGLAGPIVSAAGVLALTQLPPIVDVTLLRYFGGVEDVAAFRSAMSLSQISAPALGIIIAMSNNTRKGANFREFFNIVWEFRAIFAVIVFNGFLIAAITPVAAPLVFPGVNFGGVSFAILAATVTVGFANRIFSFVMYVERKHYSVVAGFGVAIIIAYMFVFILGPRLQTVIAASLLLQTTYMVINILAVRRTLVRKTLYAE